MITAAGYYFGVEEKPRGHVACRDWTVRGPYIAELAGASVRATLSEAPPYWLLDLGDHGAYLFAADTQTVTIERPASSLALGELALTGPVLLHALAHQGVYVWHASAIVAAAGGATALVADSGVGKSSLAAAAARMDWHRIADDLLPVALESDQHPVVRPHLEQPKLEAAEQYPATAPGSLPLRAVLRLRRGDRAALAPLSPRAAVELAVTATVASRTFPGSALETHLAFCARIGQLVGSGELLAAELTVAERADDVDGAVREALAVLAAAVQPFGRESRHEHG